MDSYMTISHTRLACLPSRWVSPGCSIKSYWTESHMEFCQISTTDPANIRLDEDVLKTSLRRLSSSSSEDVFKTSWRRLDQDEYVCLSLTSSEDVFKTSWSRPIYSSWLYVFKTSSRRFQDVFKTSCKNVFKTSSRRLQDVLQRYLQDVFKTYHQVKLFLLTNLRDVFNTFLRRTAKTVIYRRICLGHTSEKFMVSVQNLPEWQKFLKF